MADDGRETEDQLAEEARMAILREIKTTGREGGLVWPPPQLLQLTEAYAWLLRADQPHGSSAAPPAK